MNLKKYIFLCLIIIIGHNVNAVPGNYYNGIDSNQTCSSLKTALFHLISVDTHLVYSQVDNNYYRTDSKLSENGSGRLELVERYCSDNPNGMDYCFFNPDSICSGGAYFCQCFNKEHVVPKAWFNGSNNFSVKEYTDMHYLWPSDSKTNGVKSNFPLGYVYVDSSTFTSLNGTRIGTSYSSKNYNYNLSRVFEPIDSFKGDFARAYLYFVTRYQDSVPSFTRNTIAHDVFSATSYAGLQPWILQLCVKWHKQDPPSAFEIKRNDSVFAIQGNRNPYIDFPGWVERVFGENGNASTCLTSGISNKKTIDFSIYPNPVSDGLLHINISSALSENDWLSVSDIVGRKLIEEKINYSKSPVLDVSSLVNGIYFLSINSTEGSNVITFIKE